MLLTKAKTVLVRTNRAVIELLKSFDGRYEPAKHYMRGPGPKARAAATRDLGPAQDPAKAQAST